MKCIPAEGITNDALIAAATQELYKIGFSYCMKNKWIKKDKATGLITAIVTEPKDELQVIPSSPPHPRTPSSILRTPTAPSLRLFLAAPTPSS